MDNKTIASRCKELFQGDLANVTGPPAMLAPLSVVEVGHCWAQRPAVFAAPAFESEAEQRCLLVLRMVLIALRSQVYIGGSPKTSIRKPLNAFLGELFLAEWTDERPHGAPDSANSGGTAGHNHNENHNHRPDRRARAGTVASTATTTSTVLSTVSSHASSASVSSEASAASAVSSASSDSSSVDAPSSCHCGSTHLTTRLVAEQVSHHPPITAMHIADETHGVRADGYARVEMTFSGSIQVRQIGHAVVHIDRYDEDYLIPLPDVRVRGFLSGRLYPEIIGTYHMVASSGYTVELVFSGAGFVRGKRNSFTARLCQTDSSASGSTSSKNTPLYTLEGVWSEGWTTTDARTGKVLERYVVDAPENAPAPICLPAKADQDPWESRRAWETVIDGIVSGNLSQTVSEKTKIEQAQRQMRAREATAGETWEPLFFHSHNQHDKSHHHQHKPFSKHHAKAAHDTFHRLAKGKDWKLHDDRTKGVWRVNEDKIRCTQRPFRGELTPLG